MNYLKRRIAYYFNGPYLFWLCIGLNGGTVLQKRHGDNYEIYLVAIVGCAFALELVLKMVFRVKKDY